MEPFTKALLDRAKGLAGVVLRGVHFVGQSVDGPGSPQSDSTEGHVTYAGVDLLFDHEALRVCSSDEFTDGTFELSLQPAPVAQIDDGDDAAYGGDDGVWTDLVGQQIVSSKIHWVDSPYVALTKRRRAFSSHHFDVDGAIPFSGPQAPLALELRFADGARVLFVSGSWKGDGQPLVETGAGISVLWDADRFATLVPRIAKELKKSW